MFSKLFLDILPRTGKLSRPRDFEWERFQKTAKEQFLWLREHGRKIPSLFNGLNNKSSSISM
jgi:hypothetical protein